MSSAGGGAAPPLPAPGDQLGAYHLIEVLGEGGMGVVYLAEHTRLGRTVALKLLRPELATDVTLTTRFVAEARAVNQLEHRNVIEVTDIVEGEHTYYIMERLRGESLAVELARGPVELPRALDIAGQLAAALAAVHDADIVHCDVKPDNVFIEAGEGGAPLVKLIDFGIARLPGDEAGAAAGLQERSAADLVGTPAYLSPEQADGGAVTYETDVYSFGVVLYELVVGRRPFEAATIDEMVLMHLSVTPKPPGEAGARAVPRALEDLAMHCLAKRPDERPTSMHEVELRLWRARDELAPEAVAAPARRSQRLVVAAASAAVAVAAIAAALALSNRTTTPVAAPGSAAAPAATVAEPMPAVPASTPAAEPARPGRRESTAPVSASAPPGRPEPARPAPARHRSAPARAPAVTLVSVTIDSAPRGAAVKNEAGKLVCVTPCRAELPAGRAQNLVFVLPGHTEAARKVVPADGAFVAATLERAPGR